MAKGHDRQWRIEVIVGIHFKFGVREGHVSLSTTFLFCDWLSLQNIFVLYGKPIMTVGCLNGRALYMKVEYVL